MNIQAVRHCELFVKKIQRGNNAKKMSIGDARRRKAKWAKVTSNDERGVGSIKYVMAGKCPTVAKW